VPLLCNRRLYGDRASIRMWCSHVLTAPAIEKSSQNTFLSTRIVCIRTAEKNLLSGVVCLLTTGGLIRVRRGTHMLLLANPPKETALTSWDCHWPGLRRLDK
jgi:hypothetical protein